MGWSNPWLLASIARRVRERLAVGLVTNSHAKNEYTCMQKLHFWGGCEMWRQTGQRQHPVTEEMYMKRAAGCCGCHRGHQPQESKRPDTGHQPQSLISPDPIPDAEWKTPSRSVVKRCRMQGPVYNTRRGRCHESKRSSVKRMRDRFKQQRWRGGPSHQHRGRS